MIRFVHHKKQNKMNNTEAIEFLESISRLLKDQELKSIRGAFKMALKKEIDRLKRLSNQIN